MSDPRLVWALFAPLIAGVVVALFMQSLPARWRSGRFGAWPAVAALIAACAGPVSQALLVLWTREGAGLPGLDLSLEISPAVRLTLVVIDAALLCALLLTWPPNVAGTRSRWSLPFALAVMFAASLLALALTSSDRLVSIVCLLAAAIPVSALAGYPLPPIEQSEGDHELVSLSRRLAGGLKQMALATVSTGLLLAGALVLARYPFNLERTGALQLGVGLLAVGLAVRAGTMPFGGSSADLVEESPQAAIVMLGAVTPAVLVVGLLTLSPADAPLPPVPQSGRQAAMALAVVGALLAGVRALAVRSERERQRVSGFALLVSVSIALQTAWALFGVLAGSRAGEAGAVLLAANIALSTPLLLAARRNGLALAVGAGSLLGLPPLGGFAGTLLVARTAVDVGGPWLASLLLGSLLTAAAWVASRGWVMEESPREEQFAIRAPLTLLTWALTGAQLLLFLLSLWIFSAL